MSDQYSPNLFLFQSYVGQVLKDCKKQIKTGPFQNLNTEQIFQTHNNQHIDNFHQYFLSAMSHNTKTREIACINYEKLIRQALVDKDHLPPSLISSVLTACASAGHAAGSTSGSSSLGSASLATKPQGQSLHIGNMIKSMLLNTYQPSSELSQGLNYLLDGCRKKYAFVYNSMLEEIYKELLVKYRQPPIKVFLANYLDMLLDQVEVYIEEDEHKYASRKLDEKNNKVEMAIFKEDGSYGKFGKCFCCRKEANHYSKEQWLPICGLNCREKLKSLMLECNGTEPFHLMGWLLDSLHSGDEIILTFLHRQLQFAQNKHSIQVNQILSILKILIHQLGSSTMSTSLIGILTLLMVRWKSLVPEEDITSELEGRLQRYYKIYLIEVLNIVEQLPISKQYLHYINFFNQVLRNDDILVKLFVNYDSKFFETPILARMFNLVSQYAKKFHSQLEGLAQVVKALFNRFVAQGKRNDQWDGYAEFMKKREARRIITAFNKKPKNGIKMLLSLFEKEHHLEDCSLSQSQISDRQEERPDKKEEIKKEEQVEGQDNRQQEQYEGELKQSRRSKLSLDDEKLDSDNIINKRIDQLRQEHPSINQIQLSNKQLEKSQEIEQKYENIDVDFPPMKKIEKATTSREANSVDLSRNEQATKHLNMNKHHSMENLSSSSAVNKEKVSLTPEQIALFILQNIQLKSWTSSDSKIPIPIPLLSKTKVGEYFGTEDSLVRLISMALLKIYDLQNLEIDDVMRIVMNIYNLPKQTQQIQRILGDLSLRLMGIHDLEDDTSVYQYIYLLLMVQTTGHNPQVRESQKLSLEAYLSMCKTIKGGIDMKLAESHYRRIASNSLNNKMKYPEQSIFYSKYAESIPVREELLDGEKGNLSRSILLYLWEYLVIGLVLPGNNIGLFETTILFGREGLEDQQKGFFEALRKSPVDQSEPQLLKIAIQYGNDLIGKPWAAVVSLIYSLQQTNDCSAILDKLFTNSAEITPPRMRDILQALLEFSSSQFRRDAQYTRELFVLRHINSLIEYNISRFDVLTPLCWNLLRNYFRDICLHPRKEISMPAVDSLKQAALKLVKLRIEAVPHGALLEIFLHVFERSGVEMKDLIANVLLNLITQNLRGGWDSIYSILDVLDTRDKQLVVKLIARLIGQVGLDRLGNLPKLHAICIKQLRVCSDDTVTEKLLSQLWQISSFIDESTIWLETIGSIKDIFKISLNPDIINIFVKLSNRCISGIELEKEGGPRSLDREVLAEVIDVLMFLLDLKGRSKTPALIASLDAISSLDLNFIVKYLVGNCGLLEIFRLFLSGDQKITFAIFFKSFTKDILLPHLKNGDCDSQIQYLSYWCVNEYLNHIPAELFNLKGKDKDFEQNLSAFLSQPQLAEGQKPRVLIEFHLSNKDNYQKSLVHLIFLDIVEAIYVKLREFTIEKQKILMGKIEEAVLESFDCAFKFNKLILLRNFLWNNGFLAGKMLPGLMKQEHRSLLVLINNFPTRIIYDKMIMYLEKFRENIANHDKLKQLNDPNRIEGKRRKNSRHIEEDRRQESKGLSVYINDVALWVVEAQKGVSNILKTIKSILQSPNEEFQLKQEDKLHLVNQILGIFELASLPQTICPDLSDTLNTLYEIKL